LEPGVRANWYLSNTGLGSRAINTIITNGDNLFLGMDYYGVIISDDNGLSWTRVSTGIENQNVYSLNVKDSILYAGVNVDGVWARPLSEIITGISKGPITVPNYFSLEQNYPNPFNPSTKIRYSIAQPGLVTLKIYDVLGNEIERLVSEEKPVETYEINWNAANLPSGVYFYQLKAGEYTSAKKMILLK